MDARFTVELLASFADKKRDGAAKHAFKVNEFVAMNVAKLLTVA